MKRAVIFVILICHPRFSYCNGKFDFGLFENEPFLKTVASEDRKISSLFEYFNKEYEDSTLNEFLETQTRVKADLNFIQHPINVYQVIKKYVHVYPSMLEKVFPVDLKYKIQAQVNLTKRIQYISHDDFKRSLNGLVHIIFSYDLDIDKFARGIIPANLHGNKDKDLVSERPLLADDLFNIAIHAVDFGYLGTAATVMKAALKASRANDGNKEFEKKMQGMARSIVKLHNGYLGRWRSVFTDDYALRPYLLDDGLAKRSKQPKYIRTGEVNHAENIFPAFEIDSQFVKTSSMLQSCGGARIKEPETLNKNPPVVPNPAEINSHRCVMVHHKDPFTKLGPFKIEYVHHNPFFLIIHELLTEEDMDYIRIWATPRLSRERKITQSNHQRIVGKSVQTWLQERTWNPATGQVLSVDHPRGLDIARRIERAVKMNLTSLHASLPIQVTNYGLGGLVEDHNDPYGYNEGTRLSPELSDLANSGDIMATVMGWLSDTTAGGATTFFNGVDLISLWPTKGAAGFWYGIFTDGSKDNAVVHGGCPVIAGNKWIINKWIMTFDQWNKLPCDTQRKQRHKVWPTASGF